MKKSDRRTERSLDEDTFLFVVAKAGRLPEPRDSYLPRPRAKGRSPAPGTRTAPWVEVQT
jgi:hypothetical protein